MAILAVCLLQADNLVLFVQLPPENLAFWAMVWFQNGVPVDPVVLFSATFWSLKTPRRFINA